MYTIYYNGLELTFENVYTWNLAIMSYLYENKALTAVKDGLGGCIIN